MKRTEIIETAKQLVISHGPSNCLEFAGEIVAEQVKVKNDLSAWADVEAHPDYQPVYDETCRQARRVYDFLGYIAPGTN